MTNKLPPVVLSLSGHDPSGGAGIQADIETLHALHCHAVTVVTCLTVQDTCNVSQLHPVGSELIIQQAKAILADMPVKAFKIGLIGNLDNITAISDIIRQHPHIPVILDPVLAAGGGRQLSNESIAEAIMDNIVPYTTLITPNIPEAHILTQHDDLQECANILSQQGCQYSLITGTHSNSQQVTNQLYQGDNLIDSMEWNRLPHVYHGSGCTLASAVAGYLSLGYSMKAAVLEAQDFTWKSLSKSNPLGKCQYIPHRI